MAPHLPVYPINHREIRSHGALPAPARRLGGPSACNLQNGTRGDARFSRRSTRALACSACRRLRSRSPAGRGTPASTSTIPQDASRVHNLSGGSHPPHRHRAPSARGPTVTACAHVGTCGKSVGISIAMCAARSYPSYCVLGWKVRAVGRQPATHRPRLHGLPDRSAPRSGGDGPWIHHPWSMDIWMGGADRAGEVSPSRLGRCAAALALAARSLEPLPSISRACCNCEGAELSRAEFRDKQQHACSMPPYSFLIFRKGRALLFF
jgi:hypothetical protein